MLYLTDLQFAMAIALVCTANYLTTCAIILHEKYQKVPYGQKNRRLP